ncbi:methyl-accepting chemotaxis protein [Lysinibacillus sp. BW-2-10]|uniref:methyl-accepting chemotaxis protein n=1 Tax=Lysinibacillus sp. BW-2-10 TaxID=2590030 RepID=UPI001642CA15|nr:methyl-accepting chemotaxis protein [Lysinibacillus sp. BW-2-10]
MTHEYIQTLVHFAPTFKQLFLNDVAITISDTEKVVFHSDSNAIKIGNANPVGILLKTNEPMYQVMQIRKMIQMDIPIELYGISGKITISPLFDDQKKVIGSIVIATSLDNQVKLTQVAKQFSQSSETISASTQELAASANHLKHFIENLETSQSEMRHQVENSTKILGMINSVAKNTRILGFNAGIEAARSGEYGRGFSVVAKEITKLADQSADSVNEIRRLLDQLKYKVDQVANITQETVGIASNQKASIEEISISIQNLANAAEEIEKLAKKM